MPETPPTERATPRATALLLLGAFFFSGVAGLVHQVAWTRVLRHVMGNTTFAITTVLTVFMGGLALGSFLGGRWIERRRDPLRVFALLEVGVALTALAVPLAVDALGPVYGAIYRATDGAFVPLTLARFLFCGLVLLPTATMMGATLPILVRFFAGADGAVRGVGLSAGRLYAVNTLGAVLGASGAGFVLLPHLGVARSIAVAAGLNLLVGAVGLVLHRRAGASAEIAPAAGGQRREGARDGPLLAAYALAGASALGYEVAWTRLLSSMIGSSAYAFSMMLSAFILGLGLGSLAVSRFADRVREPLRAAAWLQLGIAAAALAVVPLFAVLPVWTLGLILRVRESFWALHAAELGLLVAVMLVPTTLMGAVFPLVTRHVAERSGRAARSVGAAYSANTLGAILGSAAAGFLLVPSLGAQNTVYAAVIGNALVASVFAVRGTGGAKLGRAVLVAAPLALAGVIALLPTWNPATMYFGPFHLARVQAADEEWSGEALRADLLADEILFHEEGIDTTVTVRRARNGDLAMLVNGKPDASTSGDMPTQVLIGHLPVLLHPAPSDVLVVGLASGVTLGAVSLHPVERLDCAEISSAVVRAAAFFDRANHDVLDDPRVEILVADGRNHLALSGRRYDVIVSQPSNPWIAGVADLFTLEYFEACRAALADGGVLGVWLDGYSVDLGSFRSVVRSFLDVFPDATLWNPKGSDYLIVGTRGGLAVDVDALARRAGEPEVAADLARVGVPDLPALLGRFLTDATGAERFTVGAPRHTDDNALLEFATPRVLFQRDHLRVLRGALEAQRQPALRFLRGDDPARLRAVRDAAAERVRGRGAALRAEAKLDRGDVAGARADLRAAARGDARDPLVQGVLERLVRTARASLRGGRPAEGVELLRACLEVDPGQADAHAELGLMRLTARDCAAAREHFESALARDPDQRLAVEGLALILATHPSEAAREPARALALARRAERVEGRTPVVLRTLAGAEAAGGRVPEALALVEEALALARALDQASLLPMLQAMRQRYAAGRDWSLPCR